jgi:hypothetical protein
MATPLLSRRRNQGARGPTNPAARRCTSPAAPNSPLSIANAGLAGRHPCAPCPPPPHHRERRGRRRRPHPSANRPSSPRARRRLLLGPDISRESHVKLPTESDQTGGARKRHSAAADAVVTVEAQRQRRHARLAIPGGAPMENRDRSEAGVSPSPGGHLVFAKSRARRPLSLGGCRENGRGWCVAALFRADRSCGGVGTA